MTPEIMNSSSKSMPSSEIAQPFLQASSNMGSSSSKAVSSSCCRRTNGSLHSTAYKNIYQNLQHRSIIKASL
jgi:hypothetical protein